MKEINFPILRIIENEHLRNGAKIEVKDGMVCLIRADGEVIGRGDTLTKLFENCIWVLC